MLSELINAFTQKYKHKPTSAYFCPGRVNLIGEHIDYNGGKVLPVAISMGTWLVCAPSTDGLLHLDALGFEESYSGEIPITKIKDYWYNYPLGVFYALQNEIDLSTGLQLFFAGNLPIGSGLSSSASIEVVTAFALSKLYSLNKTNKEIALLSKQVENEFIGVNCGIMDQYAVANGKKNMALLLDCATINHKEVVADFDNYQLVIINTNKPRKLVESKYNERYKECMYALTLFKAQYEIENLCALSPEQFYKMESNWGEKDFWKRAKHVVEENARVQLSILFLAQHKINEFGELLFQSHDSLKNLYEVSCPELDTIVEFCKSYKHCIGARMTGAGFGGCAIALIHEKHFEDFAVEMMMHYKAIIGYSCGVYIAKIEDGVREINLTD